MQTIETINIKPYSNKQLCHIINEEDKVRDEHIVVEKGSNLRLLLVNNTKTNEDVASGLTITQHDDSKVEIISVYLGEGNYKQSIDIHLLGDSSRCEVKAGYLIHETSQYTMNYNLHHQGKRSVSDVVVKGALLGKSKKNFNGNLYFKRGAKGANGSEVEDALLLSPQAVSHAIPALWCDEEDVLGNHAATSGKLSKEKLFYLMSRGLSEEEAKYLMVEAELHPILEAIEDEALKAELFETMRGRMA